MQKVLILDAHQRSALAATRSLGKKGIPVVAADDTWNTLAGSSRYCSQKHVYPSPCEFPSAFIETIKQITRHDDIRIIFPMSDITTHLVLDHRHELTGLSIPSADVETFNRLADKSTLLELAAQLGIPTPQSLLIRRKEDLKPMYSELRFPVVLKPCRSRIWSDGRFIAGSVSYANSVSEAKYIVENTKCFIQHPFLVQEYIRGQGQGIFALYDQGNPLVFFAHRRLREKPPSGGVGVLTESIKVDPMLREMAEKLLGYVKWHGVAMVEFKVTLEGIPYLMEINARPWGSLQLAMDAGIDFPWLLYKLAIGESLENVNGYKCGIKSRWLLGDLDHLYLTFKQHFPQRFTWSSKLMAALRFLNFFDRTICYDVNRWDDLKPFLLELRQYIRG